MTAPLTPEGTASTQCPGSDRDREALEVVANRLRSASHLLDAFLTGEWPISPIADVGPIIQRAWEDLLRCRSWPTTAEVADLTILGGTWSPDPADG